MGEAFKVATYRGSRKPYVAGTAGEWQKVADVAGQLRGQQVGLVRTAGGRLYVSFSNQNGRSGNINNRSVAPAARSYYAVSGDGGQTWTAHRVTADESGQGWGNIAANGSWVMMVWPDNRAGKTLRYNLILDNGEKP